MISVIVPAYNEERLLSFCLEALKNQEYMGDYEIIVVDNGSADKTAKIAEEYGVKVISEPRRGIGNALRKGCKEARGEIIAITNADTIVSPDWLARIETEFFLNPDVVAVGGPGLFFDASGFIKLLPRLVPHFLSHLASFNMAMRADAYQKTGGYDPSWALGEELLLSRKLKKLGKIKFDLTLVVYTSARRFEAEFLRTLYIYLSNDLWIHLFGRPLYQEFKAIRNVKLGPAKRQLKILLAKKEKYKNRLKEYRALAKAYRDKSKQEILARKRVILDKIEKEIAKIPAYLE